MSAKKLSKSAIIAALYAVLTWGLPAISYGPLQFRVSEVLTLLAYFNPLFSPGLVVGTALANITSPLGVIDMLFGTGSSLLAFLCMRKIKNVWIASLMPALFSIFIGLEIYILSGQEVSFWLISAQIMFSQFVIVTLLGVPLFRRLLKNPTLHEWVDPVHPIENRTR